MPFTTLAGLTHDFSANKVSTVVVSGQDENGKQLYANVTFPLGSGALDPSKDIQDRSIDKAIDVLKQAVAFLETRPKFPD